MPRVSAHPADGRDLRPPGVSSDGEAMEMEQVVPEVRPPSRYLRPGRMPSGNRHNLLEPLKPPVAEAAPSPAQSSR